MRRGCHFKRIARILKIKIATGPFATLRVTAFYVILSVAEESRKLQLDSSSLTFLRMTEKTVIILSVSQES